MIHKFHDGISRELYKTHNYTKDDVLLIARALVAGFLQNDEVPKELIELSHVIASHLNINGDDEGKV